jgi:hypothetical protein
MLDPRGMSKTLVVKNKSQLTAKNKDGEKNSDPLV